MTHHRNIGVDEHPVVAGEGEFAASTKAKAVDRRNEYLRLTPNHAANLFVEVEIRDSIEDRLAIDNLNDATSRRRAAMHSMSTLRSTT